MSSAAQKFETITLSIAEHSFYHAGFESGAASALRSVAKMIREVGRLPAPEDARALAASLDAEAQSRSSIAAATLNTALRIRSRSPAAKSGEALAKRVAGFIDAVRALLSALFDRLQVELALVAQVLGL